MIFSVPVTCIAFYLLYGESMKKFVDKITNILLDLIGAGCIIATILMVADIVQPVSGTGGSMYPTFPEGNDYHLGLNTKFVTLKQGDIVQLEKKDGSGVIKRVIATPGDTVYTPDGCSFIINDTPEVYQFNDICYREISNLYAGKTWTLGEDDNFVAGDNRTNSLDSRDYGLIKEKQIKHKLIYNF